MEKRSGRLIDVITQSRVHYPTSKFTRQLPLDSFFQKWFYFEFWLRKHDLYPSKPRHGESREVQRQLSQPVEKKTLSAWIETKDLPLDYSINIPLSDLKIYLAVALRFFSSKVVSLWILAEGSLSYIQANPDMVSQERCRDSSVSRWKRKTLSAWIETEDLPLDYSINIPLSDLKIYLAVALGFLSSKVVPLWILAEGSLSYI